jgi:NitT/TauT family transport system substrate-binding protein
MTLRKTVLLAAAGNLIAITLLHSVLNLHLFARTNPANGTRQKFRIGFLPVTCHLTCPVTGFINNGFASRNPKFSLVRILR